MKLQLSLSAEAAGYFLNNTNKLFESSLIYADYKTGLIQIELTFSPSANSESVAMALFLAGQDYTMKQVKKIFSNENNLSHQPL
jgi:hypothetical protein